ncbi:M28 family peptidase [Methylocaldum gracile subsp. desertum]|uniref:M28 family peptidase n=1 Tax=Methylocaldum sp. GT1BW TaxID=3438964 RepID=UPI003D9FDFD7
MDVRNRSPMSVCGAIVLAWACFLVIALRFCLAEPSFAGTDEAAPPTIDPGRLEAHVRTLSEMLGPRDAGHPDNLDRAASYIRSAFEQAQGKTADQPFRVGRTTYRNIMASFGPPSEERIVVGAHYDTAGPYPGADDNASGVAGLIELAGLLGKADLAIRVDLVAYTLEEPPFFRSEHMGSAVHARALKAERAIVRAMFSLEMIGYFTDAEDSQSFPVPGLSLFYPTTGNFIAVVGRIGEGRLVRRIKKAMSNASSLPVHSINAPRFLPGVDFSDHLNYWEAGYPAVMITDTAFYRNPNYHAATDTPDTLDYRRMAQVVAGVHAAVLELAR